MRKGEFGLYELKIINAHRNVRILNLKNTSQKPYDVSFMVLDVSTKWIKLSEKEMTDSINYLNSFCTR